MALISVTVAKCYFSHAFGAFPVQLLKCVVELTNPAKLIRRYTNVPFKHSLKSSFSYTKLALHFPEKIAKVLDCKIDEIFELEERDWL